MFKLLAYLQYKYEIKHIYYLFITFSTSSEFVGLILKPFFYQ